MQLIASDASQVHLSSANEHVASRAVRIAAPFAAFVAIVIFFYRHALLTDEYSLPWDMRVFHLPLAAFIVDSLRAGEFPWWDPYTYAGRPFYANSQTQVFYPPAQVLLGLTAWLAPSRVLDALEWQYVIHVAAAGLFTGALARAIGCSRAASFGGAAVFALGGFFVAQGSHLGVANSFAWLPLGALALWHFSTRWSAGWWAVLTAVQALVWLAGNPPAAVTCWVTLYMFAAFVMVMLPPERRGRLAIALLSSSLCAIALAAVQLLPTLELVRWSIADQRAAHLAGYPPQIFLSMALPGYLRSTPFDAYAGAIALALAAAGALSVRRLNRWLTALAIVFAIAMMGRHLAAGRFVLDSLPRAFKGIVYPWSMLGSLQLGIALLASLGIDRVSKSALAAWVLACAVVVDLTLAGSGTRSVAARPAEVDDLVSSATTDQPDVVNRVRAISNETVPPGRIDTLEGAYRWAEGPPLFRVPSAGGEDPLALDRLIDVRTIFAGQRTRDRRQEIHTLDSPVVDLLNVRFVITPDPIDAEEAERKRYRLRLVSGGFFAYENLDVLPRFFLVQQTRRAGTRDEARAWLQDRSFLPRQSAIVEGSVEELRGSAEATGDVRVVHYDTNTVALETTTSAPSWLVTSETFYPGWHAWLDGNEVPLAITNLAFRGLAVPPGTHRIEMRFQPRIVRAGAFVSVLTLGVLAVGLVRARKAGVARSE